MSLPPKSLKQQIVKSGIKTAQRPYASNQQINQPAGMPAQRSDDLAEMDDVTTDNLPVLQAFQEFLAAERRNTRRQVMAVTSFFLLLFIIITGAAAFFAYVVFGRMNNEISFLSNELSRTKYTVQQDASELISDLIERTDSLQARIAEKETDARMTASEISSTVSNSFSVKLSELDQIRQALTDLQKENRDLKTDLARIRSGSARRSASSAMPGPAEPPVQPDRKPAAMLPEPKTGDTNKHRPVELSILAPGATETMKWRIPISE